MTGRIASPAGEELQPVAQPREKSCGRQKLRPRGRKLDRQGQSVESRAELGDRARVLLGQCEVWIGGLRTGDEELSSFIVGQRRYGHLALGRHTEWCAACHDHLHPGRRLE